MIRKINPKMLMVQCLLPLYIITGRAYLAMRSEYEKNAFESRIADLVGRIENLKKEIEND